MAGLASLGSGFLQGYSTVRGLQQQQRELALQKQQQEAMQTYRGNQMELDRDQFGLQQAQFHWGQKQDKIGNSQWARSFGLRRSNMRADNQRAASRLAIDQRQAARQAQLTELEIAQQKRAAREAQNREYLTAAMQELQANGVTPRFRTLAKKGGINVDNFLDPRWEEALNTLSAGLSGAPIRDSAMVSAANKVFADNVERMLGEQTADGQPIVRTHIADFYPALDGNSAVLDLEVWTRNAKGEVEKYRAPVSSNRRSDDDYVLTIPMEQFVGKVKALELASRAVDKRQLASVIQQEMTLNGGGFATQNGDWINGPGNTIINSDTGETRKIPTTADQGERYAKALEYAQQDLQTAIKSYALNGATTAEKQQFLLQRRNFYLELMTPGEDVAERNGGDIVIDAPADEVVAKLKAEGGSFVAPGGQYAGRTVTLNDDGTITVQAAQE